MKQQGVAMEQKDVLGLAREGLDALNAGDFERLRAVLAPDSVYAEAATQRRVQGIESIIELIRGWRTAFPDLHGIVTNGFASGNVAAIEVTWVGTQTGRLAVPGVTISMTGNRVVVPAVEVITVEGGKIAENRHYFDLLGVLRQLRVII